MGSFEGDEFLSGEPEAPVSSYVGDGMLLADGYMSSVLTPEEYSAVHELADEVVEAFARPVHAREDADSRALLKFLKQPWVRFAVELQMVDRASTTTHSLLDRYEQVQPVLSSLRLTEKSSRYLAEARRTYLLGLDAACVAFCGAALEQVLREVVRPLPARELSFEELINQARTNKQLMRYADAAHTLRKHRNHVMHKGLWEEKIESQVALTAIQNLGRVLSELGPE